METSAPFFIGGIMTRYSSDEDRDWLVREIRHAQTFAALATTRGHSVQAAMWSARALEVQEKLDALDRH